VSRRHTLPRRAVPGERARPRRHVIVAFGGSSPSAVCLLLTVSRAPGLVRLCRVAALYICVGARLRRGVSGARLSSDASPARGGAWLLPPLGRTKGTVANQRTVVTGWPGGWRSTRAPATEGARSAASHPPNRSDSLLDMPPPRLNAKQELAATLAETTGRDRRRQSHASSLPWTHSSPREVSVYAQLAHRVLARTQCRVRALALSPWRPPVAWGWHRAGRRSPRWCLLARACFAPGLARRAGV
jgi:hypothetical protein